MPEIEVITDNDGTYPEADPDKQGEVTALGLLTNDTEDGGSSVVIETTLPDGSKVYGKISVDDLSNAVAEIEEAEDMPE